MHPNIRNPKLLALLLAVCCLFSMTGCAANTTVPETFPTEAPQLQQTIPPQTTAPAPQLPEVTEPQVTQPPVTEPPVTEPPVTEPPATEPPATEPPATKPPVTEPPVTEPPVTEPPVTEPPVTEPPVTEPPEPEVSFTPVEETVYAVSSVNVRTGPGTQYEKVGSLSAGESISRTGVGDNGWSRVIYKDGPAYISSNYLSDTKPEPETSTSGYPKVYSDSSCTITITKEWFEDAWCYIAHLEFTDYDRLGTACANGKYGGGKETTSHAAKRLGAVFAVNGCYSSPNLDYVVVRSGKICNGSGRALYTPGVYSRSTGLLQSAWDVGGTPGIAGKNVDDLVAAGKVTDTFCFGPPFLMGGSPCNCSDGSRAQRTFLGTDGSAGDIWVVVSEGRYSDGASRGLTYKQCARLLAQKGCTLGIPLDGGGSSTMYFQGKVLNSAKNGQRSVVDFLYFK